jgi:nitroreductase/chorismate mutase
MATRYRRLTPHVTQAETRPPRPSRFQVVSKCVVEAALMSTLMHADPHLAPLSLPDVRRSIDQIDDQIVPLLARRLALVESAQRFKHDLIDVRDEARQAAVLAGARERAGAVGADADAIETIYRTLLAEGIAAESQRFLGVSEPGASAALELMATMRAMRRLDPRPVPDDVLQRLVEAASWAPNGGNRQAYTFITVTAREQMARLAPLWETVVDFYLSALDGAGVGQDGARHERVLEAMRYQRDHFAEIPALIAVCYKPSNLARRFLSRPRSAGDAVRAVGLRNTAQAAFNMRRWGRRASAASVYPAVENLLLAARAHGLAATMTTWHSALDSKFREALELPRGHQIYAMVPVGYPLGKFGPVRRRPVSELMMRDRFDGARRDA